MVCNLMGRRPKPARHSAREDADNGTVMKRSTLDDVLSPDVAAQLRAFRRDVFHALPGRVEELVLFGSRARGEAIAESDFDVAVLFRDEDDADAKEKVLDLAWDYQSEGLELQVLALRADDFRPARKELAIRIATDGVPFGEDWRPGEVSDTPPIEDEWNAALAFLEEAEARSALTAPRTAGHGAYYAMFHAARAVLLARDGLTAPLKHDAVVNRFGHLAKLSADQTLMAAGRQLKRAKTLREKLDYEVKLKPDTPEVEQTIKAAREFIETCAGAYGFPKPPSPAVRG